MGGVEWLHLPISGAGLSAAGDRECVKCAAAAVAGKLKAGKHVAVHCSAGLHRTGVVGYLGLRILGFSKAAAFELLGQIRWDTRAELERIYFRSQSAVAAANTEAPANLITAAEEILAGIPLAGDS